MTYQSLTELSGHFDLVYSSLVATAFITIIVVFLIVK